MPDGTGPSSTEAVRAALSAARASLERQLAMQRTDAAEDAMRQVETALELIHSNGISIVSDADWVDAADAPTAQPLPYGATHAGDDPANAARELPADASSDDLTRIRGIDGALASRLAALGIRRYTQIAAWQTEDVRVIADAMGLGRRFLAMGIVEQATDLMHRKAEPTTAMRHAIPVNEHVRMPSREVAVWQPPPVAQSLVRTSTPWAPLHGEELGRAVALIRQRLPMNHIVTLAHLVPALAQPIYVPSDTDKTSELPRWRTGVPVPFVEATAPDLIRFSAGASPKPAPEEKPKATRTIVVSAPTLDGFRPTMPPPRSTAEPSLHELATERLADLEAELDTFSISRRAHETPTVPTEVPRAQIAPRATVPDLGGSPAEARSLEDVPEAEVQIVAGSRPRPSLLAPLPVSPLATPRAASAPRESQPRGSHQVPEAAVVIVRRSGAPLRAAQLPPAATGPVRRFLQALAGR